MRGTEGAPAGLVAIYRVLVVLAIILVLAIAAGTVYALAAGKRPETRTERRPAGTKSELPGSVPAVPAPEDGGTGTGTGTEQSYFTGVGRIRAATADKPPSAVVVSIAFPYDRGDLAFSEELAAHTKVFREIAQNYLSSFTAAKLRGASEETLKGELLKRFNAELRLGKIAALYFTDYLLIE